MKNNFDNLYKFLKKEGHLFEAELLRGIIKKADSVPTRNEVIKDMLRLNSVVSTAISLVPLGSEVEYRYGHDGVAKLTTIDSLKDRSILCMSWSQRAASDLSEYSLSEALNSYPGSSEKEKLFNFFENNRSMEAFGDYNQFLGNIFGSADAVISNNTIASMSKHLYLIPPHFKVNVVGEMIVEGVTVGDLIDFATDIASVALSLGAAFYSGGALFAASIAAKLRTAAGIANIINIYNNIYNKRFFEAIIGIMALGLNIRNTKPLLRFYKKYIEGSRVNLMRLDLPEYFLDILSALLSSVTLIADEVSKSIDDFVVEKLREMFSIEMSEHEIRENLEKMASEGTDDPFIIFANEYYKNDGANALKEASENVASEIESFMRA